MGSLSAGALRHFKQTISNENRLIADAIRRLLPADGGFVVDVGAGLGDIAERAFPQREALLIDILEFDDFIAPSHRRLKIDFFDYEPGVAESIDVMLLSHVLQYIDEDHLRFRHKVARLSPHQIITVSNDETEFMHDLKRWFGAQGIAHNAESPIPGFPGSNYDLVEAQPIVSTIECKTYTDLARQIGIVIFDSPLDEEELSALARWLHRRLPSPSLVLPETVSLFRKRHG